MRIITIAAAIVISGFALSAAEAMPIAPIEDGATKNAVLVDYACGWGFHLTPWGRCRPNWDRPPPPRYAWRAPPQRYGWRHERSYGWGSRPPPWAWDRRSRDDDWR